jgi:hypothetical protein
MRFESDEKAPLSVRGFPEVRFGIAGSYSFSLECAPTFLVGP